MKIVVFGATGGTGRHVVFRALELGYTVAAYTRSPQKITETHPNLLVIEGEIGDAARIESAVRGAEAVISTLGPTDARARFVVAAGTENILASMKNSGVSRLVVTAGAGVPDPNDAPKFINRFMDFLVRSVSRSVYEDMAKTVEVVRASGLDWTIVRVPMLTDHPGTGDVTAAWVGKGMGMRLSREDLAAFLVDQLRDDTYLHMAPALSN